MTFDLINVGVDFVCEFVVLIQMSRIRSMLVGCVIIHWYARDDVVLVAQLGIRLAPEWCDCPRMT